jgi:hypothetical protein
MVAAVHVGLYAVLGVLLPVTHALHDDCVVEPSHAVAPNLAEAAGACGPEHRHVPGERRGDCAPCHAVGLLPLAHTAREPALPMAVRWAAAVQAAESAPLARSWSAPRRSRAPPFLI